MRTLIFSVIALFPVHAYSQNTMQVTAPKNDVMTWTSVNCSTTSTPFGVAGRAYLTVQVPAGTVCFGWDSNAATLLPPSQCYTSGTVISWGGGTGSCIVASGTQAISVGTK